MITNPNGSGSQARGAGPVRSIALNSGAIHDALTSGPTNLRFEH